MNKEIDVIKNLGIAIPTYNRSKYLIRLLDKIDVSFPINVPIYIRDNFSQDNTDELVNEWILSHPQRCVKFSKNSLNIGIDKNILAVIKDCSTSWVKVFGDDDYFDPILVESIDRFLVENKNTNSKLAFFNYCEYSPDLKTRITERQLHIFQDKFYSSGCEIVADIGETIPLISGLLLNRSAFIAASKDIPESIATGGVGFVWGILQMLRGGAAVFYANPLIYWANGEPERGFTWKKTVVSDFLWIVNDCCPEYLHRVKRRTIISQITPRMRRLAALRAPYRERIQLLVFLLKYYWSIPEFWLASIPRALAPDWSYCLYHRLSRS